MFIFNLPIFSKIDKNETQDIKEKKISYVFVFVLCLSVIFLLGDFLFLEYVGRCHFFRLLIHKCMIVLLFYICIVYNIIKKKI